MLDFANYSTAETNAGYPTTMQRQPGVMHLLMLLP
jgi:hypothetical protein